MGLSGVGSASLIQDPSPVADDREEDDERGADDMFEVVEVCCFLE